jgi:hypothetical protein
MDAHARVLVSKLAHKGLIDSKIKFCQFELVVVVHLLAKPLILKKRLITLPAIDSPCLCLFV